ncbi:hypothetical protein CLOM_g1753 [Closterium sp. NIES-68]|nr:hypothetical protein CLOM_g1753 [Closterium sp. NIES-68]
MICHIATLPSSLRLYLPCLAPPSPPSPLPPLTCHFHLTMRLPIPSLSFPLAFSPSLSSPFPPNPFFTSPSRPPFPLRHCLAPFASLHPSSRPSGSLPLPLHFPSLFPPFPCWGEWGSKVRGSAPSEESDGGEGKPGEMGRDGAASAPLRPPLVSPSPFPSPVPSLLAPFP